MNKKRFLFIAITFTGIIGLLFHTQIKNNVVFLLVGYKAPLKVKLSCISSSRHQTQQKFTLPLKFDQSAKDALRGYWYYAYFSACLHNQGFDHMGESLPSSQVFSQNDQYVYQNPQVGITITSPEPISIISDNQIDPNLDTRLLQSKLNIDSNTHLILAYKSHDHITDLQSAASSIRSIPTTNHTVSSTLTSSSSPYPHLILGLEDQSTALVFFREKLPTIIYPAISPNQISNIGQ